MSWQPPDDIYDGYSLWENFGYGPKGEVDRVRKLLLSLDYETTDDTVKELLSLTKELVPIVRSNCQEEITQIQEISRQLIITGDAPPCDMWLVFQVVNAILMAAQTGLTLLQFMEDRKAKGVKNPEILEKAVKKLSINKAANEVVVERTERWRVSFRKKKSN